MDDDDLAALQQTITDCTERCLFAAAQWTAELYASKPVVLDPPLNSSTSARHNATGRRSLGSSDSALVDVANEITQVPLDGAMEADRLVVARAYFNSRQFDRVGSLLKACRSSPAKFLKAYSCYLATEQRIAQNTISRKYNGQADSSNSPLEAILVDLNVPSDPYLLFLKGLIMHRLARKAEAATCFIQCVTTKPWLWSVWLKLGECLEDVDELVAIQEFLPDHPMAKLFAMKLMIDFHTPSDEELRTANELLQLFPQSIYLLTQKALIHYHQKDWLQAEQIFDYIHANDPCRIDDMEVYSNILHVMEKRTKLSKLAHDLVSVDKDRPEVCCIVGNHYSLRGDHEKAVKYLRRAVQLDRTHLSAWTLMGHEYIEMKHSESAIEAYRKAVDIDRRDYRAWFGLGQAYELLSMHQYALHYYQRATALRPYDARVWQAIATCYSELSRSREAIECYKRAQISLDTHDTAISLKIAGLYDSLGDSRSAAIYHRQIVSTNRKEGKAVVEYAKSCLFLGRFYLQRASGSEQVQNPSKQAVVQTESRPVSLGYAKQYLQIVAESNAEETAVASDMLRRAKKLET